MTPVDLYRTCRVSAYRLETRQVYAVGAVDVERRRAAAAGEPLPPPSKGKLDDLKLINELRRSGKQVGRIHIITWPLTDYLRYELAIYPENISAGEYVRIADASAEPSLAELTTDFAIFDGETDHPSLILFNYSEDGQIHGYEQSTDPIIIQSCWEQYRYAYDHSIPLEEFAAAWGRSSAQ